MAARGGFLYAAGGSYEVDRGGWVVKLGIDGQSFATIWTSDDEAPIEVAADSTRVYVSTTANTDAGKEVGKGVYAFPNTGGATTRLSDSGWHGMATDETDVYYSTSDGKLVRQPLGGGATTVLVTGHDAYEIVVRADAVYWAEPDPGEIWKVAK
jgi:hypothetical protein